MAANMAITAADLPHTGIGEQGARLDEMLAESERLTAETGCYRGLERMWLKEVDPLRFEKLFSRLRGGLVSARETALNISASPIVRELGEICFALYTPEGDSVALSTGIIVHVHTMSDAIKFMIRNGWEDNPKIRPGDIFANNQPTIGDVHNCDVQTFVPIFWDEELIGWAGGVIHVMDIGAAAPGGVPVGITTRYEDGIDLHCMKIGEADEIARWHLKRVSLMSRAPGLWLLDERTRLAGCHMIRDVVERIVRDEGLDTFKAFTREAIEDGRRAFKSRVRTLTVPGRYRAPGFHDAKFADKPAMPKRARNDFIMHGAYEVVIGADGQWTTDLRGSSAWGWHVFNGTPSAMQGMQWIQFTQTLICNDKINDGAYYATDMKLTPGSWCDVGENPGSSSLPWNPMYSTFTGYLRSLSRALQSRGYIEEIVTSFVAPGNVMQGGGINQHGSMSGFINFEIGAQGQGGKYVVDGLDYGAAAFNPEGDMGDVEMWETIQPTLYLSREINPGSPGLGRHRGGASTNSLFLVWGTRDFELENIGTGSMFVSPGLFGGYPGPSGYVHTVFAADVLERARRGENYPLSEPDREHSPLLEVAGEHLFVQDAYTTTYAVKTGDLYLSVGRAGGGVGDPLLRPAGAVRRDVETGHLLPRLAKTAYGIDDRDAYRRRRLERARPTREWWARQRERVLAQDLIEPVKLMLAESMRLSPEWAAEYRGFWDLPEDFDFDIITPTVEVERAAPGKVTPEESVRAFLASSRTWRPDDDLMLPHPSPMTAEVLADLLDEKLSRRSVKDVQSAAKDPGRFETWVALLQDRVEYDDPIVLPYGEGLNIVRRWSDGELTIRTDAGADLCRWDQNWKMHARVFVRETDEQFEEIFPKFGHPEEGWQELREYYCPVSGHLLETEAVPPGYPVVHEYLPDLEGLYRGWLGRDVPA